MAEPTPTNGEPVLTEAEQKQLDALLAKRDAVAQAAAERTRLEQLEALASVGALIKLVATPKIREAIDTVLNDTGVSFAVKQQVQSFSDSLRYNIEGLQSQIDSLSVPVAKI